MVKEHLKQIALIFDEVAQPLFETERGVQSSWIAFVLFSLLLSVTFIETLFSWHEDLTLAQKNQIVTTHEMNFSQAITDIPKQHLFGDANISDNYVPITSLQLRLVGIIKSIPDNLSHVMIAEKDNAGKVYAIGDSLPSGIRVYAINNDGVILENAGHLEKLPLSRPSLIFGDRPKAIDFSGVDHAD